MITMTIPSTATLGSACETPFVLPTGADAFWQLGMAHTGFGGHDIEGYVRNAQTDAKTKAVDADAASRRTRVAAKPAGPPRGVPR